MNLICENYFEKRLERRIESFEKETLLGLFDIIDKMHKHSIQDYKNVINYHLNDENGKITDSIKFEKVYSKQFYSMFEQIAEEFQWRLKDLKSELEKRLDIRYKNESDNELEDESDNKSKNESKIPSFIKDGRYKTIGKYKIHENSPLKNLSEAELDEKFKKVGFIRGFKDVESTEENKITHLGPKCKKKII